MKKPFRTIARRRCRHSAALVVLPMLMLATPVTRGNDVAPSMPIAGPLVLEEADNGRVVEVATGATLTVILHSTYWQNSPSSAPGVVVEAGSPAIRADLARCRPGAGCGTVTQAYTALAAGQAELSAERVVCGEAMACRPSQRRYAVTVRVR